MGTTEGDFSGITKSHGKKNPIIIKILKLFFIITTDGLEY